MLRLAILYENRLGRNDGNPLYVYASLKRMEAAGKLKVDHLVPNGDYSKFGHYDAVIVVDWGEDGLTGRLPYKVDYETFPADIKLYWASDTHIKAATHDSYDYRLSIAKWADIAFVAQKNAVARMEDDGVIATWLPHAVEPRAYNDSDDPTGVRPYNLISKKNDLCFVGHVNSENRVEALDRMFREFPNFYYGQKLFNEAARKYAESKIVFNIAMADDVNMRCFEVMGSKSFLLTDRVQSLDELMVDGKHCVMYGSLDEAVDKARYYLANDDEREAIANSGYKHVMANHTIDHRVETMLNKLFEKYPQLKEEKELV